MEGALLYVIDTARLNQPGFFFCPGKNRNAYSAYMRAIIDKNVKLLPPKIINSEGVNKNPSGGGRRTDNRKDGQRSRPFPAAERHKTGCGR